MGATNLKCASEMLLNKKKRLPKIGQSFVCIICILYLQQELLFRKHLVQFLFLHQ